LATITAIIIRQAYFLVHPSVGLAVFGVTLDIHFSFDKHNRELPVQARLHELFDFYCHSENISRQRATIRVQPKSTHTPENTDEKSPVKLAYPLLILASYENLNPLQIAY